MIGLSLSLPFMIKLMEAFLPRSVTFISGNETNGLVDEAKFALQRHFRINHYHPSLQSNDLVLWMYDALSNLPGFLASHHEAQILIVFPDGASLRQFPGCDLTDKIWTLDFRHRVLYEKYRANGHEVGAN